MKTATNGSREELHRIADRLRGLREDKQRASQVLEAAKQSAAETETDAAVNAALAAKNAAAEIDRQIEEASEEQTLLLRKLGDAERGLPGLTTAAVGVSGWDLAADRLDLEKEVHRVDVPGGSLLASVGTRPIGPAPRDGSASIVGGGDRAPAGTARYLYPALETGTFNPLSLVETDFTVNSWPATEGDIGPRAPDSTTQKATMTPDVSLAEVSAESFAIIIAGVPTKLFDRDALRGLLGGEAARRLSDKVDEHVVSSILAAAPPSGSTGTSLVEKLRRAISDHVALGSTPSVIGLSPGDAAALDLSKDEGGYIFSTRIAGDGSPVWSMRAREVPSLTDGIQVLIDPARLGLLYVGDGAIVADPYSGLHTNQVDVRVEVDGAWHTRDVLGAFVIDESV